MICTAESPTTQVIDLLNAGHLDEALSVLIQQLHQAHAEGDLQRAAEACEQMANLRMLRHDPAGALRMLQSAMRLRQAAQNWRAVACLCWSIGMLARQLGDSATARRALIRAVALAERQGLPQADRYRAELKAL